MKLMKMTDFVLSFGTESNRYNYEQAYDLISSYARFLKTNLNLGMFIPCDEKMNILKKPKNKSNLGSGKTDAVELLKYENKLRDYNYALSKVLFKDFHLHIDYEDNFKKHVMTEGFVLSIESLYTMKVEDIVDNDIELTRIGINAIYE
jgi:hypothetical protein